MRYYIPLRPASFLHAADIQSKNQLSKTSAKGQTYVMHDILHMHKDAYIWLALLHDWTNDMAHLNRVAQD